MGRGGSGESLKVRLYLTWRWRQLVWRTGTFVKMNLIPPFSSQVLDHMAPWAVLWNSHAFPHPTPPVTEHFPSLWFPWNTLLFQWQTARSFTGFRPLLKCSLLGERSHTTHGKHQLHPSLPLVLPCPALSCPLAVSYFLHLWQPLGMGLWVKGEAGRG